MSWNSLQEVEGVMNYGPPSTQNSVFQYPPTRPALRVHPSSGTVNESRICTATACFSYPKHLAAIHNFQSQPAAPMRDYERLPGAFGERLRPGEMRSLVPAAAAAAATTMPHQVATNPYAFRPLLEPDQYSFPTATHSTFAPINGMPWGDGSAGEASFGGLSGPVPSGELINPLLPAEKRAQILKMMAMSSNPVKKVDNEEEDWPPMPGILSGGVDASQYANILDADWPNASIDYNVASPSSVETQEVSPATPAVPEEESFPNFLFRQQFENGETGLLGKPLPAYRDPGSEFVASMAALPHGQYNPLNTMQAFRPLPGQDPASRPRIAPPQCSSHTDAKPAMRNGRLGDYQAVAPAQDAYDDEEDDGEGDDEDEVSLAGGMTRTQQDRFILAKRAEGLSYSEIKEKGGFDEALSTLRGRVRALTKTKAERVRKPVWHTTDLMLLRRAVRLCDDGILPKARGAAGRRGLPWKKVSGWLKDNGASYAFAPATCARKWEELRRGQ